MKTSARLDAVTKAYTAGIIDGEGSISLAVHTTTKTKSGRPAHSPMLLVQVANTDKSLIFWLRKKWAMGHVVVVYRPSRPEHKTAYGWRVWGANAATLLTEVLPYLLVKKRQARLGLKARALIGHPGGKIGDRAMTMHLGLRDKMIALNGTQNRPSVVKRRLAEQLTGIVTCS